MREHIRDRWGFVVVPLILFAITAAFLVSRDGAPISPISLQADTPRPTIVPVYTLPPTLTPAPTEFPECIREPGGVIACRSEGQTCLTVDVEIRDTSGSTLDSKQIETDVCKELLKPTPFALATRSAPTLIVIDISDMAVGELWLRAREGKFMDTATFIGMVMGQDGTVLPPDGRGFVLYQDLYRNYITVIEVEIR